MSKRILGAILVFAMLMTNTISVSASPISDAKKNKQEAESKLDALNDDIENIEEEKEELEEEFAEYEAELSSLLLNVQLIESDIEDKETEIVIAEGELNVALQLEEAQRLAMNKRIKYMYEKGDMNYLEMLLESKNYVEAVNKYMYSEKLYEYDRLHLYMYAETKKQVEEKKAILEEDLSELEEIEADLSEQEAELQALVDQCAESIENFDEKLSTAKAEATKYKNEIKKQSDSIRALETAEKKKLEEEAKKKALEDAKRLAEEAAKKKKEEDAKKKENVLSDIIVDNSTTVVSDSKTESEDGKNNDQDEKHEIEQTHNSDNSDSKSETVENEKPSTDEPSDNKEADNNVTEDEPQKEPEPVEEESESKPSSSGSALGKEIANFACQYVGNPYVSGGTSLTNGADCSGFTQAVYSNFGISLPRTSGSQAMVGTSVSYSEAAPGDIIYYGGHVGIYIGNGLIVHASTQSTGIKISNALYRSIISVRRIV